jgi:O-methyltransferase involved in polyketide biosynthesis
LEAAGFDPRVPTVWVAEGLCYYLSLAANAALLTSAGAASALGSTWVATHIPRCNLDANRAAPASSALAGLFRVCGEDVGGGGEYAAAG